MLQATFGVLRQVLLDLGFTMRAGPKSIRFDHTPTGTWFLFVPYAEGDEVGAGDLVAARRILDERGLMPRERFEELLRQKLIAG
jgi:hypothetical protein